MVAWSIYFRLKRNRVVELRNEWLTRFEGDDARVLQTHIHLVERTAEVGRLLRGAGIPDGQIPFVTPIGWGQLATGRASLFDNWLATTSDVPAAMEAAFLRAAGVYQDRSRRSLNPLWWVELVLTAPQHVVRWLGGSGEGALTKLATLVWAVITGGGALLGLIVSLKNLFGQ